MYVVHTEAWANVGQYGISSEQFSSLFVFIKINQNKEGWKSKQTILIGSRQGV